MVLGWPRSDIFNTRLSMIPPPLDFPQPAGELFRRWLDFWNYFSD
jgi:hypothetical protein